jgi:DNA-binding NarL/FixJ family response regulator
MSAMRCRQRVVIEREKREVLAALLLGLTDKEIAKETGITYARTTDAIRRLLVQHEARNRLELAIKVVRAEYEAAS